MFQLYDHQQGRIIYTNNYLRLLHKLIHPSEQVTYDYFFSLSVNHITGVKMCATSGHDKKAPWLHCYRVMHMSIPRCGVNFIANLLVSLSYGLLIAIRFRNIKLRNKVVLTYDIKKYKFSKGWKWIEEQWHYHKLLIKSLKYSTEKQILITITLQNIHPLFHISTRFISHFYALSFPCLIHTVFCPVKTSFGK